MTTRKLRAGRIPGVSAETWVGDKGTIFYNENSGALRISDGVTPGGNPLTLIASDFQFQFGDFVATTNIGAHGDTAAYLSSLNDDEDIILQSNGAGGVGVIGEFGIWPPDGPINTRQPIFRVSDDGQVRILVTSADPTAAAVNIVGSTTGAYQPPVNTGVMLHLTGNLDTPSRLYNDSQGSFAAFVARRYNGTVASPTAVLDGEELLRISGTAHNGTSLPGTGNQRILYKALGNQTTSNQGGTIELWATPQNTTTIAKVASVDNVNGITSTKFTAEAGTTSRAPITLTAGTNLTTAAAGNIEYDGKSFYATPLGTQRGLVPAFQWFMLDADRSMTFNTTTAQSLFGVSPTLTANTRYYFRLKAVITRTTGDNNTVLTIGWGGNATLSRVAFTCQSKVGALGTVANESLVEHTITSNFNNAYTLTVISNPPSISTVILTGIIGVGASGGTVTPNITWSGGTAAGAVTVYATSNWQLHPISSTGANTQVGNWS